MEFVEPEDEPQLFRTPPAPDDRLWRHPSEISVTRAPAGRQLWVVGVASAVTASLLTAGLVLVVGSVLRADPARPRAGNRLLSAPPTAGGASVVDIAERARSAIVQVRVGAGRAGSGSGIMFRSDGEVLTNAHVVEGGSSITVVLSNGREMAAAIVGSDAETDTAVVKVDGGPFPVATLGSAADLKVGQLAIAIGSPLGLAGGPSVTVGVVSALHRTVRTRNSTSSLVDMVQTDAPIAPGSSGGALLDGNGAVIGVTTAVAVTDSGNEGFGFAIPIDMARIAAEQLMTSGRVTSVWIGIDGSDLDGTTAVDLNVDGGAMVGQVKPDSPAEHAGLSAHDVIVSVDGRTVNSMGMLVVALRGHRPGDVVSLDIVREHQHRNMKVTLAERPPGS